MKEIWKDIKGYEGLYCVSNKGRVKSCERKLYCKRNNSFSLKKERILKLQMSSKNYYQVNLCKEGSQKTVLVHHLVAYSFIGKRKGLIIDHIDNDRKNNIVENLQYTTHRVNLSKDRKNKTSKYTGVCWHKIKNKWSCSIMINKNRVYLGAFEDEEEAGITYKKALKYKYLYKGVSKLFREQLKQMKLK